jgi:hypothetical protein
VQIQIPSPHPPIDTGVKQQTWPVPPVSQPEQMAYAARERNRYIVPTYAHLHPGPTVQSTDPIPPVSGPLFNYYNRDINRCIWEGPEQMFEGPTVQQMYAFPVNQPEVNSFERIRQLIRTNPEVVKSFIGPTIQQTYVFPVNQPEASVLTAPQRNRYIVEAKRWTDEGFIGIPQIYIFPVNEPEFSRFVELSRVSRIVDAPHLFYGPTVQQTIPIPPISQPEMIGQVLARSQGLRHIVDAPKLWYGPTILRTDPIPGVSGPDPNFLQRLQRLQYLASSRIDEPFVAVVVSKGEYAIIVGYTTRMGEQGPTIGGIM